MREQEEALMRENEEAQRLEDEADEASKLRDEDADDGATTTPVPGHDEAARDSELVGSQLNEQSFAANGDLGDYQANGIGNGSDLDGSGSAADGSSLDHEKSRKQEILTH